MKKIYLLLSFVFVVISGCGYSQQQDSTLRYYLDGKYYTQQEIDSMRAQYSELEKTLGDKKYSIKSDNYRNPFYKSGEHLYSAGYLFTAGQFTSLAGIGVTVIGAAAKEEYFYIASGCLIIASIVCLVIAGREMKKAGEEFQKISVENGKIVIKIE